MRFKLLIDECLIPGVAALAWAAGHEATCVRDRGWLGLKDHELIEHVVAGDYTLVTHNSKDFRGPARRSIRGRRWDLHGLRVRHSRTLIAAERERRHGN